MNHPDHPVSAAAGPAPMSAEQAREFSRHFRGYVVIGALQLVFTLITVALAFRGAGMVAVLLSASVNAGMVAFILMHLKSEKSTIWSLLFFTAIFMVVLFGLTLFSHYDPIMGTELSHH